MKMKMKRVICGICVAAAAAGGFVACGGDDDSSSGQSPEAAARDSGDTAASLNSLKSDPADEEALGNVLELYADAQSISALGLDPTANQPGAADVIVTKSVRTFAQLGNCVSGSNPYTYTNCVIEPTTFNGTLSVSGDEMAFDISFEVDPNAIGGLINEALGESAGPVSFSIERVTAREQTSALTVTDTRVDGVIQLSTTVVGSTTISIPGGGDITTPLNNVVSNVMTFTDLALDSDGCPVGGTLLVTQTSDSFYRPVSVTYGPACGDIDAVVVTD